MGDSERWPVGSDYSLRRSGIGSCLAAPGENEVCRLDGGGRDEGRWPRPVHESEKEGPTRPLHRDSFLTRPWSVVHHPSSIVVPFAEQTSLDTGLGDDVGV